MLFAVFGRDVFVVFWVWKTRAGRVFLLLLRCVSLSRSEDVPSATVRITPMPTTNCKPAPWCFNTGEVVSGQGKEERVRRMMWLGLLDTKSNRSRLGGGNSNIF